LLLAFALRTYNASASAAPRRCGDDALRDFVAHGNDRCGICGATRMIDVRFVGLLA
jgi:hypothetical protein